MTSPWIHALRPTETEANDGRSDYARALEEARYKLTLTVLKCTRSLVGLGAVLLALILMAGSAALVAFCGLFVRSCIASGFTTARVATGLHLPMGLSLAASSLTTVTCAALWRRHRRRFPGSSRGVAVLDDQGVRSPSPPPGGPRMP